MSSNPVKQVSRQIMSKPSTSQVPQCVVIDDDDCECIDEDDLVMECQEDELEPSQTTINDRHMDEYRMASKQMEEIKRKVAAATKAALAAASLKKTAAVEAAKAATIAKAAKDAALAEAAAVAKRLKAAAQAASLYTHNLNPYPESNWENKDYMVSPVVQHEAGYY